MRPDLVHGTITYQKADTRIHLTETRTSATVSIDEVEAYTLSFRNRHTFFHKCGTYDLIDQKGQIARSWEFRFSFSKTTLDCSLKPDHPLQYTRTFFGNSFFTTPVSKKPTYMDLIDDSRSFELEDMKFLHQDFESEMSFVCPKDRLAQAILVANLLFSPPNFGDSA